MSCLLTQGFTWDCKVESAGVKAIYLVEFNTGDTVTKASGEITAHSLTGGRAYFKWELEKETATFTPKIMPSQTNGAVAYEADIVFKLHGLSTAKRNELKLLAKTKSRVIVRDNEDNYWLCGADTGCDMVEATTEFGTAYGDFKGTNVTLRHRETDLPAKLQSSVVTSLSLS